MSASGLSQNPTIAGRRLDARSGKYLTFALSNEEFGIRVLKVREIMGPQEITAVPQTLNVCNHDRFLHSIGRRRLPCLNWKSSGT